MTENTRAFRKTRIGQVVSDKMDKTIVVDLSTIGTGEEVSIRVSGIDDEDRLYSFLAEMLFIEDCDNLILKEFDVSFDGDDVICNARGETLDRNRHRIRSEVKAITYHMMEIDRELPSVTVIFDV